MTLRTRAGAVLFDLPRLIASLPPGRWIHMRNRREATAFDGRGIRCDWEFTSDLHVAKVFPSAGARLMSAAFRQWPVVLADAPQPFAGTPDVAFVIGHRGLERLPHLLTTLKSIAGQSGARVECIVVEQDVEPRVEAKLPRWVRYRFTPCDTPYNRAATLNAGVSASAAPVVILHDNDMIVPAGYAAECAARTGEGFDFLELKRFTFYLSESETHRVFESGRVPSSVPSTIVQNLLGASIGARREAYLAAGGFDKEFVGWGGEDNEFWERAEATGRVDRFGYLPFLHLHHAPQREKADPNAPAVLRYRRLRDVPVEERIRRLREKLRTED